MGTVMAVGHLPAELLGRPLPGPVSTARSHRRHRSGVAYLLGRPLTPREWQALAAMGRNATVKEMAAALGVGYQTGKNHLTHIYAKLGVANLVAALLAVGWLHVPGAAEVEAQGNRARVIADLARLRREIVSLAERMGAVA